MVEHTQKICRQFADELLECVLPFFGLALKGSINDEICMNRGLSFAKQKKSFNLAAKTWIYLKTVSVVTCHSDLFYEMRGVLLFITRCESSVSIFKFKN